MAAGQRPISNVVDITNYVMLLTGQPLHAFDLDRVAGAELTVRLATPGEQVQTLDDQTRTLDEQMMLIADRDGPTSIAGVMGGARSEVHAGTTRVLMEAANWNGANVHDTSLKLGLRSEASNRFEKGLQPEQTLEAQAVASTLMIELCGATLVPGTIDVGGPGPPPETIRLRDERITALLGIEIPRERCAEILQALEFKVGSRVRRARRDRSRVPPRRRDPRGRPDRGGRPARRARRAARDAALTARRVGPIDATPAAAPARVRPAGRAGSRRGCRLELRQPRPGAQAAAARAPGGQAPERDVERAVTAAHGADRFAARHREPQPRPRRRGDQAVRGRRGLHPGGATRCPASPTTSARCSPARCDRPPGATRRRARSTSSPPRACSPGCSAGSASTGGWSRRPSPSRSCIPGAPRGSCSMATRPDGSARSILRSRPSGAGHSRSPDSSSISTRSRSGTSSPATAT